VKARAALPKLFRVKVWQEFTFHCDWQEFFHCSRADAHFIIFLFDYLKYVVLKFKKRECKTNLEICYKIIY